MQYLSAFLLTVLAVTISIPFLSKLAVKADFMDKPTERKKHKSPTPLTGGIAMAIGFIAAYAVFIGIKDFKDAAILTGGLLILFIGTVDDWYKTKGKEFAVFPRVVVQIVSCSLVFAAGIRFTGFMNPVTDTYVLLPIWLQYILTVGWIFGVSTVTNFSDGLDGLAGGLCAISGTTLFVTALFMGQSDAAYMSIILVGSTLAFLRKNLFPAKIFMGDSGANFLGYILAVISLFGVFKQATAISVFIPVLALGVPIFDNIFVVLKRFAERKPIYKADAGQLHYRMLKKGLNPVQTVYIIFLIAVCLNLASIILLLL